MDGCRSGNLEEDEYERLLFMLIAVYTGATRAQPPSVNGSKLMFCQLWPRMCLWFKASY
jgi:hypothetical protein